jgi:outer membrane protein assembly complex protein YaeT
MILVRLLIPRSTFFIIFAAAIVANAPAQTTQQFEGRTIAEIQFEPKQQPLDAEELISILPLKSGSPLHMEDVRSTITRLFATGEYRDIQIDAEPRGDQVVIRILTKSSWFVGRLEATGNISDPPNAAQLINTTGLNLGEPYSEDKLTQAVGALKKLLDANGLYHAAVEPRYEYDAERQQVNLSFVVSSGARARYATPSLGGGDLKLPAEKIVSATKWRRWKPLGWVLGTWKPVSQNKTHRGADNVAGLYQKSGRLESKVSLGTIHYDSGTNTVHPALDITPGPKVQIKAIGAKISKKKLQEYVPVYEERTVDRDLLVEGQRNLVDYLQSQGFFDAEVEFKQQQPRNDRADIDYIINPGHRHRLVSIQIAGNRYFKTESIRERLFLQKASVLQYRHGRYSASLLRRDEESIANLYRSNGFRDVTVTSRAEDDYKGKPGDIAVFITIDEGPQYFVAELDVQGITRLNRADILSSLSSSAGQPFSEYNVAVDHDVILNAYFSNGFPNATFQWSFTPAAQPHQVVLKYVVKEGEQQFVREVLTDGLNETRPSLLKHAMVLKAGDPLSPLQMTETQRKLYDLGIFSKVDTAIQNPDGDTERKYVLYQMYEARRYSLTGGFGAEFARIGGCSNCLEAPAGQAGFSPRVEFDVSRLNMFGLGHTVTFSSRVSTLDRRALTNYSFPRFRGSDKLQLTFTALYDNTRDVRTFTATRLEGSVQVSQKFTKATTFFYRYSYRRVGVSSLNISPLLAPLLAAPVRVGQLSFSVIFDRRDDPIDPRKGVYTTIDVGIAEHIIGSQRNFSRFLGRNSTYHRIGKRLVLARNTTFGELHSFKYSGDPLDAIPLPERFFSGGGTSHRGFPENQAGPRDPTTGFPLGGTALLFNQTELRFPLLGDNIGGVLFHDMGNVYSSIGKVSFRVHQRDLDDFDYMVHAVGFGIRYRTPVGPVRIDLGYSINPPHFFGFKGTQNDLLTAGPNPCAPGAPRANQCTVQNISHFQYFFSIGQTF